MESTRSMESTKRTIDRLVFRAVPGIIAEIGTHRRFKIMPALRVGVPLVFDPKRFIDVDLDASPSRQSDWSQVGVDDRGIRTDGGVMPAPAANGQLPAGYDLTSLGNVGDDLVRGRLVGVVYLEDSYFQKELPKIGQWPPPEYALYQLTSVQYAKNLQGEPRTGKRYVGFHARLKEVKGDLGQIEILRPQPLPPQGPHWIDFKSVTERDPAPPGLAAGDKLLDLSDPPGTTGAIFLELGRVTTLLINNPKLPIGLGP